MPLFCHGQSSSERTLSIILFVLRRLDLPEENEITLIFEGRKKYKSGKSIPFQPQFSTETFNHFSTRYHNNQKFTSSQRMSKPVFLLFSFKRRIALCVTPRLTFKPFFLRCCESAFSVELCLLRFGAVEDVEEVSEEP